MGDQKQLFIDQYELTETSGEGAYDTVIKARHIRITNNMEATLEEQEQLFMDQYEATETETSAEGVYGTVFEARHIQSGTCVAMKKIIWKTEEDGIPSFAMREIDILSGLSHPNVVKLLDFFCSTTKLLLVLEFCDSDLGKYLKQMKHAGHSVPPVSVKKLAYQLCRGVEFCHSKGVLHRDIKPQNLLVDSNLKLKITGFSLARTFNVPIPKYTPLVVTLWYRAPEILLGSEIYSTPVDLWSVWCVVAEVASGVPLFAGDSEIDTLFRIFRTLGTPTCEMWPGLRGLLYFKSTFPSWAPKGWANIRNLAQQIGTAGLDLLEQGMVYDPARRLSARRALKHHFFHS